jgi:hypothetical protein
MPRLVDTGHNITAQERGKTIDIQVSAAQTAAAVTNSNTPPANSDKTPTVIQVTLDKWKETRFHLSDQEMTQIMAPDSQFVPGQIGEGMKALANAVDADLLAEYTSVLSANTDGFFGSSGTTPFSTEALFNAVYTKGALKALKDNLSPLDDIACVMDTAAEANMLSLAKFTDADRVGDANGLVRGELGTKLGARWVMDQNMPTHTNDPTGWLTNQADHAIGDTTITIDTGSNAPAAGDMFTIAGDTTEYHVTGYAANVITYTPEAVVAADDNDALTFTDYIPNLCFHRSAFALASAPLSIANIDPANTNMVSIIDPVTNLAVRLEVRRDYKQWTWDMDILYGVKTVRDDLAALMLG